MFEERFSAGTLKELQGIYFGIDFEPIIPLKEPLTTANFALILGDNIYYADNFRWYEEDGSDRDLCYDNSERYFFSDNLPNEVFCLLNTVICIKFAMQHLNEAISLLDTLNFTDDNNLKQTITNAIADFAKTSDSKEKLQIAKNALSNSELAYFGFGEASAIIEEVLKEIEEMS